MPERPDFEDELTHALRRAGETFHADQHLLTLGGAAYGRRLRRRRALSVTGAAAAVALLLAGTVAVGGLPGEAGGPVLPASGASSFAPTPAPVSTLAGLTAEQLVTALTERLGGLRVVDSHATDSTESNQTGHVVRVWVTVDDGQGRGLVQVAVNRRAKLPGGTFVDNDCPLSQLIPAETCKSTPMEDGSVLRVRESRPPDSRQIARFVTLATVDGLWVEAETANIDNPIDRRGGRRMPPLTVDQLRTIATDPVWRPVLSAIPADGLDAFVQTPMLAGDRIEAVLQPMLPPGATVSQLVPRRNNLQVRVNGGEVNIYLRDWRTPPTGLAADEFAGAQRLPDGTLLLARNESVGGSSRRNVVQLLRPDRLLVTVSALSRPAETGLREPVMSLAQLRVIAREVAAAATLP